MEHKNLILIPGWNIKADIFKPFVYALSEQYTCHLITPPLASSGSDAYSQAINYFLKYIRDNNLTQLHILGWSMGGQLAMLLAEKINLERLILMNSAAIFSRDQTNKQSFYELCETDFPRAIKYFHKLMGKLNLEDSILIKNNFIDDQQNALAYLQELHTRDLSAPARNINCPTLIIHSLQDQIIPYSEAEYLNKLIKNSKLISLNSDFHFPFLNAYAKITPTITGQI